MDRKVSYLECNCGGGDHVLRFTACDDGDVYIDMALNHYCGFWRRLWLGMRYAFGYRSSYGYFTELMTNKKELRKFVDDVCGDGSQ
jgi:hypothetical protein